ncbi:MAG: hypothetical protein IRY91_11165 [Gemmatimonadaceae bacterium]|nr:hypothetical protein [Gemmatimonadaceae bacterium]
MGKTKLTLSVDGEIVKRAKEFADRHDTSVSALVEDFLRRLEGGARWPAGEGAPIVARLRGLGAPSGGREEYRRHLEEKYG